jgi:hypothetical protein
VFVVQVSEPHLLILNKLVNSRHQQRIFNLSLVLNLILIQLPYLVISILPLHKCIKIGIEIPLDICSGYRGFLGQKCGHAQSVLIQCFCLFVVIVVVQDSDASVGIVALIITLVVFV